MGSQKYTKNEFLKKYPELVAQGLSETDIAKELGIGRATLYRYKDKWIDNPEDDEEDPEEDDHPNNPDETGEDETDETGDELEQILDTDLIQSQDEIEELKAKREQEALSEGEDRARRSIEITFQKIIKTINTIDAFREKVQETDLDDPYFTTTNSKGEEYQYFQSEFEKDQYIVSTISQASSEARGLLNLARTIFKKDQVVQRMQLNIDNRGGEGISESMFFGALRYGLKVLDDDQAIEVTERIEDYLNERDAIDLGERDVSR